MANVKKIFLKAMLGGLTKGSEGFVESKNRQREYAIKELAAQPKPSAFQKAYEFIGGLPPEERSSASELYTGGLFRTSPTGDPRRLPPPGPQTPAIITKQSAIGRMRNYLDWEAGGGQGPSPPRPSEQDIELYRGSEEWEEDKFRYKKKPETLLDGQ